MEKMKPIKQPPTSEKEIDANLSDEKLKKEESVQQEIDQDGSEIEWMMHSSAGYKNKPKLKNKPRNSKTKKTISEPVKPDEMATKEIKGRNAADVGGKKKSSSTSKKKAVEDGEATVVSQEDVCKAATIVLSRRKTKKGVYSGASELNSPFTRKDSKKVVAIKTVESATAPKNSLEAVSIEALDLAAACLELGTEAAAKSESSGKKDVGHGTSGFKPSFTEEKAKKAVATGTVEFGSATAKNTQEAAASIEAVEMKASYVELVTKEVATGTVEFGSATEKNTHEAAASIEAVEMKASCVELVTKAVAIGTKEPESAYAENSKEASSIVPVGIETAAINDQVKPPIDTRARPKEKEVLRKKNTTEPSSTKNQEFRNERMKKNFSALRNRQMFPRCHGCNIFFQSEELQKGEGFVLPRIIEKCGHDICEKCIINIFETGAATVECPFPGCKTISSSLDLNQYPVNNLLLDLISNMKPIPVPQLERVHEDLSIPSTCVHHKKETRFYFIGLDMFGCEICAEEIPSYAVSIHQFPPYNQRLLFDINGLITAWKTRKVQTLKSLENPLLEFQHTIRKKIRDLHREVDKLENKLIKQLQDELFHQQELKDRASQDQNEEILHLLKLQEMAKQSLVLQSDSASCNTYKLEKLISDLENKTPTFIEWMGVPHLDLDPEYLNRILEDNIQLSVNYPHISQDCAILPESEPEPVIQVINQPLTSVEITPAELVSVTHINSPSLFYIRKVSSQDLLYSLRVLLQRQGLQRVGAEEIKLDLEICSNLRRGRVTRINENSVHLYLLDSGETVEAAKGSLYHLPDLARQQPPLAYPCKLRFVEPLLSHVVEGGEKKWRIGAIQEFVTLTRNKKLVIPSYSSSDSILEIDLCYLPQPNTSLQEYVNLGDILVFRELAAHTHNKPDKKRNFPFPQPNYSHREEACVVVERVFSPQWFYVRSSGSAIKKRVDAIKQEIQKIDVRTLTLILAPAVNQPCIFIGESLFRGVISRVLREKKVEVTLIDVGTTAVCQLKAIRSIPHQLLSIQCLVRLVRLDDVFPVSGEDWNASANTAFKNITLGKEFRMCLETPAEPDQPLTVSLYESYSDCDVSINSLMVYLNHARCKDRRHIQVKFIKPDSGTKNKQGFNMFNANILPWGPFPPRLPQPRPRPLKVFTPGTEIKCKVVSVVSPNRICVIPEEFISEEINLTTRIIEEVRREGVVLKELKVGIKCLARNSSMSFCRGVLLEVGEDRCKVYYIDLGSIELCHNQEIFKYSHIFEDIPCLMVPVHLATIYPAGGPCWSATAIDKLKDAVIEHYSMFNVQVLDRPVSGSVAGVSVSSVPVQLIHRDYKLDIFDSEAELKEKTFNLAESLVSDGLAIRYSSQDNNKSRDNFLLRLQNLREKEKQYFQSVHYRMKSTKVSLYKVLENNFTWKKASLPLSSEFKCILTGLNKDGLYLQSFEEQSHNMSSINSGLNLRYGSSIPRKVDFYLSAEDPVIVFDKISNTWYRGRICRIKDLENIEVECVDFSTRITVTFVQIRKHLAFTDIPIQVFRVKLNCLPMYKDWDEYTLDFLQNNINQEPLTAKVLKAGDDKSDPIVSIRLPSSRDAASLLVECGLARKMVI